MKVLSVASEIFPLVKTGGLADVAGALPAALASQGVAMRSLVPGYPRVIAGIKNIEPVHGFDSLFGGPAKLLSASAGDLELYVLDAPHLFERDGGPYGDATGKDWPDNWMRFAALSKAGAQMAAGAVAAFVPDIVHVHDWQSALTPVYMKYGSAHATPSVMTVHNLAFQGQYAADIFPARHTRG